jgi:hypothetical protein
MPSITFTGRIFPPLLSLTASAGPLTFSEQIVGNVEATYAINKTDVKIVCKTATDVSDAPLMVLCWWALNLVTASIDSIAFTHGIPLSVEVDRWETGIPSAVSLPSETPIIMSHTPAAFSAKASAHAASSNA